MLLYIKPKNLQCIPYAATFLQLGVCSSLTGDQILSVLRTPVADTPVIVTLALQLNVGVPITPLALKFTVSNLLSV